MGRERERGGGGGVFVVGLGSSGGTMGDRWGVGWFRSPRRFGQYKKKITPPGCTCTIPSFVCAHHTVGAKRSAARDDRRLSSLT